MEMFLQNPVTLVELIMVALGGLAYLFPKRLLKLFGAVAFVGAELAILFGIISRLMDGHPAPSDPAWTVFVFATVFIAVFIRSHLPASADEDDPDDNLVHPDYTGID